jgi:hypothetical protein
MQNVGIYSQRQKLSESEIHNKKEIFLQTQRIHKNTTSLINK